MTAEELRELIAGGESFTVEFKGETRGARNDRELVETVVCLANGDGGIILVGVEDDGQVTGALPRHEAGTTDPDRLRALIANRTQPPVRAGVEICELDGIAVTVVEVPDEPRVVGTSEARYVRRAIGGDGKPACVLFHAHEMLAHEVERGGSTTRAWRSRRHAGTISIRSSSSGFAA